MPVMPVMLPVMLPVMPVVMAKINQTLLSLVRPRFTNHTEIQKNCSHKTIEQDIHTQWTSNIL